MYSEKIDTKTLGISELVAVPSWALEQMSRQKVMEFCTPRNCRKRLNGVSQLDEDSPGSVYGRQNSLTCGHWRTTVNSTEGANYNMNTAEFPDVASSVASMDQELDLKQTTSVEAGLAGIVGQSAAFREVLQLVDMVAETDSTVLLLGETGTDKELIAHAIHDRSRRKNRAFVKLNCAAIPTGLLESELFGHERSAFTGAVAQKTGRVELADQGSLFLDEIGDIPLRLQAKLLRVLEEREFERLGSTRTRQANVRVIAATHRNLEEMIAEKQLRRDLYYALNIFPILIPPLRIMARVNEVLHARELSDTAVGSTMRDQNERIQQE